MVTLCKPKRRSFLQVVNGVWGSTDEHRSLTYAELGDRLGTTQEAARSLARRLTPRHAGNDSKARVTVDLTEINYKPLRNRSPGGHRSDSDDRNARVEQLEGELARLEVEKQCLEVRAASNQADFERNGTLRHARNRSSETGQACYFGSRKSRATGR